VLKKRTRLKWMSTDSTSENWKEIWLGLRFYPFLIGLEGLLGESRGIAVLLSVYLGTT
jgi:hypothetical protein